MNCTQYQNMLDDYLDRSLSPVQYENLQTHLHHCEQCNNFYKTQQNVLFSLKYWADLNGLFTTFVGIELAC